MAAMTLKAVRAKEGDALLLSTPGATVLIDGGPPGVFKRFLKQHLEALDDGGVEPPVIDLMMVSHIDSDHIAGILDLTGDMIEAEQDDARPLVQISRAWFNGFADTIALTGLETPEESSASAASVASAFDDLGFSLPGQEHTGMVLASVSQGRKLRSDLETLSISINARFRDNLALAGNADKPWTEGDLELTVIGPTQAEVGKLKKEWAKQLPKILDKEAKKAARTAAAASLDKSVFNLASIVVIAKAGGKKMLLTGDARGDMILPWLEAEGFAGGKAHFDLIKLPHHGSDRNVTPEFFEKVTADHYVVCGDGKHGNPEPETFRMLFEARGDDPYTIHMTYAPDELKQHKDFKEDGKDVALDEVLGDAPDSVKLKFPAACETAISVDL